MTKRELIKTLRECEASHDTRVIVNAPGVRGKTIETQLLITTVALEPLEPGEGEIIIIYADPPQGNQL